MYLILTTYLEQKLHHLDKSPSCGQYDGGRASEVRVVVHVRSYIDFGIGLEKKLCNVHVVISDRYDQRLIVV